MIVENRNVEDVDALLKTENTSLEPSEIQQFYRNSTIFITGSSGFLGCLLVEKLLRSCPDLNSIYVLIRAKKGKSPSERIDELFNNVIFEKLRDINPKFTEKVKYLIGDLELPNLGLEQNDIQILEDKIDVVFHVAATVRFDEKLRKAANINVRSTRDLIFIAKNMKMLRSFVYVSTAYANCIRQEIDEVFYDTPYTCDKLLQICNSLEDAELEMITPKLIGKWPNTYTFTKAIAESVCRSYGQNIPITIVRLSIVMTTYKKPVPGWINNIVGPVGFWVGTGLGIIHTQHSKSEVLVDVVPADYAVNSIISAAWQIGTMKNEAFIKRDVNIPIYNYVGYPELKITIGDMMELMYTHGLKAKSSKTIWYPYLIRTSNWYFYTFLTFLLETLQGYFIDTLLLLVRKKTILSKSYVRIHKYLEKTSYFSLNEWYFQKDNVNTLWKTLNKTDQYLFEFDMKLVDVNTWFFIMARFGRVYMLKDPLETIPKAEIRFQILRVINFLYWTLLCFILYKFLSFVFYIVF